jgi:hydroxymethylpyrimidine pyrophosphatase-like HAD family hydrolase
VRVKQIYARKHKFSEANVENPKEKNQFSIEIIGHSDKRLVHRYSFTPEQYPNFNKWVNFNFPYVCVANSSSSFWEYDFNKKAISKAYKNT